MTPARHVDGDAKRRLDLAVRRFDAGEGRVHFAAWVKSAEMTAQPGLLLCGDLRVATGRLRAETRNIAELTLDQKREDRLAFCASERAARARTMPSVDVRSSVRWPPVSERQMGRGRFGLHVSAG